MQNKLNRRRGIGRAAFIDPLRLQEQREALLVRTYDKGFNYVKKLRDHSSCVNAVAFSSNDGRWLGTGGDDRRLLIWDLWQEDINRPVHTFIGANANIFEIAFSAKDSYVFCGGVDACVRRYDMGRLGQSSWEGSQPTSTFVHHAHSIRAIAPHPVNESLYLTASEDGSLYHHDTREQVPVHRLRTRAGWAGAQFHPSMEYSFIAAKDQGPDSIAMYDIRKLRRSCESGDDNIVQRYATKTIGKKGTVRYDHTDITFDRSGDRFAVANSNFLPVVYATADPYPIAVCSGRCRPDGSAVPPGERTYSSRATIKHISFGGPGLDSDIYISTGSDDFRGYVWKLPPTAELLDRRIVIEDDDTPFDPPENFVGFTLSDEDEKLYSPVELPQPTFRLGGHQSIVNSALWHPALPRIVTCGIESKVVLHSPFGDIDGCEKVDSNNVRKRLESKDRQRIMRGDAQFPEPLSEGEELSTIMSFDRVLEQEERWHGIGEGDGDGIEDEDDDSSGMQTLANLLGIDASSEVGQLLIAALGLRQIITENVDIDRADAGREGSPENDAGEVNDEEVDMEIDEV